MSATLDAGPVAAFLEAPIVRAEGRPYPVTIVHEDAREATDARALELRVASAVRRALGDTPDGHVLVFLPGAAEIRRAIDACASAAQKYDAVVLPLHGDLPPDEQDRAVGPSTRRKVIVSTNVAESSVTIEGVAAVVDSGLVRRAEHSPYTGLPSLRVEKASRASCTQRAGRAGRTREGRAYRLYTKADFDARPEHETPELLRVDLTQTVLELRASGALDYAGSTRRRRRRSPRPKSFSRGSARSTRAAPSPRPAARCCACRSTRASRAWSSRPSGAAWPTTA